MCVESIRSGRSDLAKNQAVLVTLLTWLSLSVHATSLEQGTATQLPELLEKQGWVRQSGQDGSLYYHPPQPGQVAVETKEEIAEDGSQVDIPQLLLERGWRIESNAHGDMLLVPVSPPEPPDIDQLLRERGWRILTDMDGNTLLMPVAPVAVEPPMSGSTARTRPAEPASTIVDQPIANAPTMQFRQALQGKGWTVQTESDGSMIVYPPVSTPQTPRQRDTISLSNCEGITLGVEEVQRPVDSEDEARLLGTAWIAQFGHAGHEVGKVRRINQIFVVSIVESLPPHTLLNQLVVREDGSIIALY